MKKKNDVKNEIKGKRLIKRVSVVDQVCDSIKEDIVNGVYQEGEKIPSEEELASQFGVNRLSVRMALQKLNMLGLVETRVGDGTHVTAFSFNPFLSELAVFYERQSCYEDVVQLRNLLEVECMRQAISKASNEEKNKLREKLDEYSKITAEIAADVNNEKILERLVDADFEFHLQIIHISHNALYQDIYVMVQVLIREHIKSMLKKRISARVKAGLSPKVTSDTHDKMYEAIVSGDKDILKKLGEEMLGITPVEGMDTFDKMST